MIFGRKELEEKAFKLFPKYEGLKGYNIAFVH
jgi:hypothetical protein